MSAVEALRHRINPLHVYCRLKERGLTKASAMLICKLYEILFYNWMLRR